MSKQKWCIEDLISVGEDVLYECTLENEDGEKNIKVYLTNYRIVWIEGNFVDSRLLRFISKYGVFIGYDDFAEENDKGCGEYGIYFGDNESYETLWFYSETVWKAFYRELSRCVLETVL